MNVFKKVICVIAFLIAGFTARATEFFSYDGLLYRISRIDMTAGVVEDVQMNRDLLTDVVVPDRALLNGQWYDVTYIEHSAFNGYTKLKSVTIGRNVKKIGSSAFSGCTNLSQVNFDGYSSLEEIGAYAFGDTQLLKNAPDGLVYIGDNLITYKGTMTSHLDIKEGTRLIANKALSGQSLMKTVNIPNSVVHIGEQAFYGCEGLTSISLPNVGTIGADAFGGCLNLAQCKFNDGIWYIDGNVLYGTKWYNQQNDGLVYLGSYLLGIKGNIPENMVVKEGTTLMVNWGGCETLKTLQLPSTLRYWTNYVNDSYSRKLTNLTSISVSSSNFWFSSVDGILYNKEKDKVLYCPQAKTGHVILPVSVKTIGKYSFSASNISSIDLNNVRDIEGGAFEDCQNLSSIDFKKVKRIGYDAFMYCENLSSIDFGNVSDIGAWAFYRCTGLTSVDLKNVEIIREVAFENCSSLSSVKFHNIKEIEGTPVEYDGTRRHAFVGTPWYNSQPDGVVYIGDIVYQYKGVMSPGTSIVLEDHAKSICNAAFMRYENLVSIDLKNVEKIGDGAFFRCEGLNSVEMRNVKDIRHFAFGQCRNLTAVNINNAQHIEARAFWCGLTSIRLGSYCPPLLSSSKEGDAFFRGAYSTIVLEVPSGSLSVYQQADGWKYFKNIREIQGERIVLNDGIDTYQHPYDQACEGIEYNRNFSNTNWQSFYIPFGMNYSDWSSDFEIARLNNFHQYDDNNDGIVDRTILEAFVLKENSKIEPNTPYAIRAKVPGHKNISLNNVMVKRAEETQYECSSLSTKYIFNGTYTGVPGDVMYDKRYYAMSGGGLKQASQPAALGGFRWYVSVEDRNGNKLNAPKMIQLQFIDGDGNVTGVEDMEISQGNTATWPADVYDLDGRKLKSGVMNLSGLPKGIYVVNGRKVIK